MGFGVCFGDDSYSDFIVSSTQTDALIKEFEDDLNRAGYAQLWQAWPFVVEVAEFITGLFEKTQGSLLKREFAPKVVDTMSSEKSEYSFAMVDIMSAKKSIGWDFLVYTPRGRVELWITPFFVTVVRPRVRPGRYRFDLEDESIQELIAKVSNDISKECSNALNEI